MANDSDRALRDEILRKAEVFGACAAGIADVQVLKTSPSHLAYGKIGADTTIGNREGRHEPGTVSRQRWCFQPTSLQ